MLTIIKKTLYCFLFLSVIAVTGFAQSGPDQIINMDGQGVALNNQNVNNLYSVQQTTAATVSAINGYYANGLLSTKNGGTAQDSSAWTSGDVVYMSSAGVWGHSSLSSLGGHGAQIFTSSGTFTAPAGVTTVYLTMCGAGGGGATGGNTVTGGGGAAAGAGVVNMPYPVTPGNTYAVVIGAGGTTGSGASADGHDGASSSFDSVVIANGGGHGLGNGTGGTAGAATSFSGSSATAGPRGGFIVGGGGGNNSGNTGGGGGASLCGVGSNGASGNANNANDNTGAGGGGGGANPARNGGTGGSGFLSLTW